MSPWAAISDRLTARRTAPPPRYRLSGIARVPRPESDRVRASPRHGPAGPGFAGARLKSADGAGVNAIAFRAGGQKLGAALLQNLSLIHI